jgi:hypothetical protein
LIVAPSSLQFFHIDQNPGFFESATEKSTCGAVDNAREVARFPRVSRGSALHRGDGDALFQSHQEQHKPERDGGYANSQQKQHGISPLPRNKPAKFIRPYEYFPMRFIKL